MTPPPEHFATAGHRLVAALKPERTTMPTDPQQLLDLPLPDNDSGATTVRGYLVALLAELWREEDNFSGKKPFGNSDWQYDLYVPMVRAGMVPGAFDEDDDLVDFDYQPADELIQQAITALGNGGAR